MKTTVEIASNGSNSSIVSDSKKDLRRAARARKVNAFSANASAVGSMRQQGWSDSIQAVLEQPPARLPRYLILLGLVFSSVFVSWAYIGTMQEVSRAQGELIPQGETYKVEPVIEGKVDRIFIREGDYVEQGQVLLSLESDLLESEVGRLEQALEATEKEILHMRSLIEKTIQEAQANRQIAAANIQAQRIDIEQSETSIETSEALLQALHSDLDARVERFNRISRLEAQGAISQEYLFGIESSVREQQQTITQSQGQRDQTVAQVRKGQAELNQKIAEESQTALLAQQSLQKMLIEEQQLNRNLADLSIQLAQAKTKLSQSYITASTDGVVSTLALDNAGEVVQPGQTLAEIVPENTPLILSALVPHQEAGLLTVGMETQIKMDAFPYQDYGILSGEVISISPDAKVKGAAVNGYQINVSLDEDFVVHEQQMVKLQVGQTANVEVVVRQRRIIEMLSDPIRQLKESKLSL